MLLYSALVATSWPIQSLLPTPLRRPTETHLLDFRHFEPGLDLRGSPIPPRLAFSPSRAHPMEQQDTYLMPASPAGGRRASADYQPSVKKAQGNVPACLVNASVTYCSNDRIYAFGGFDQYTDEGPTPMISPVPPHPRANGANALSL